MSLYCCWRQCCLLLCLSALLGLGLTTLVVTHDLPYALELCPRALVMNDGRIVADGPAREILADDELMRANRLELPFGFDPARC